jgi:hypothetical protein
MLTGKEVKALGLKRKDSPLGMGCEGCAFADGEYKGVECAVVPCLALEYDGKKEPRRVVWVEKVKK